MGLVGFTSVLEPICAFQMPVCVEVINLYFS